MGPTTLSPPGQEIGVNVAIRKMNSATYLTLKYSPGDGHLAMKEAAIET